MSSGAWTGRWTRNGQHAKENTNGEERRKWGGERPQNENRESATPKSEQRVASEGDSEGGFWIIAAQNKPKPNLGSFEFGAHLKAPHSHGAHQTGLFLISMFEFQKKK